MILLEHRRALPPHRRGPAATGCLALLLASLVLNTSCSGGRANGKPGQPSFFPAVPVMVGTATQKTVPVEVRAIGNAEAYSTVTVRSQVEGQLERIHFREGQEVKKGDLLFRIDSRPFEATLRQAEANLARDTAQAKNARSQAERNNKLYEAGIVSRDQFDRFRTDADALDAAVRADKAAVENAKIQLSYCSIYSPVDGLTGSLLVHEGNVVKANDASLVVINRLSPIYVTFSVPEQYFSEIKKRQMQGRLKVRAMIPGEETRPARGQLSFLNNLVDSATGTILLKGIFVNEDRRLWPGQFVNVLLTLSLRPNATVVPHQAVQTGQTGQYVFVVKNDLTVELRPVTAGETFEGDTEVEKGLRPGERVVTDGQLLLYPGAKVEIKKSLS